MSKNRFSAWIINLEIMVDNVSLIYNSDKDNYDIGIHINTFNKVLLNGFMLLNGVILNKTYETLMYYDTAHINGETVIVNSKYFVLYLNGTFLNN